MASFAASRAFASPSPAFGSSSPPIPKAKDPWDVPSPEHEEPAYAPHERPRTRPEIARNVLHDEESSALDDALAFFRMSRQQLMGGESGSAGLGLGMDDGEDFGDLDDLDDMDELEELGSSGEEDRGSGEEGDSYIDDSYGARDEGDSSFEALEPESLDMESDSFSTDVEDAYASASSGLDDAMDHPTTLTIEELEQLLAERLASGEVDYSDILAPVAEESFEQKDEEYADYR
jgi:hypothetical protein